MADPIVSGIYKITFPSGNFYIGKSIDVYARWKQHTDKLKKGTAAKPMQVQWNTHKQFKAECIFECHPDHIDIMEAFYISRMLPPLNTTRPQDPFPGMSFDKIDSIAAWFHMSTVEHITLMEKYKVELDSTKKDLTNTSKKRSAEEIQTTLGKELSKTIQQSYIKDLEIDSLKSQLRYAQIPWWQKLFS